MDHSEGARVVDQYRPVLTCSDQFGSVVRESAVPNLVVVLIEVGADVQGKVTSVAHMIGI